MKKLLLIPTFFAALFLCGCGTTNDSNGKIRLEFKPESGKAVKISYKFSVHQVTSGEVSEFELISSGIAEFDPDGNILMEIKNDKITMAGNIQGKKVSGSASGPDSLTGDAKLVALPVFALEGKTFKSIYDPQFNKKSEVRINGNDIDSSENKIQLLIRYPKGEIAVGDKWKKEIVIKTGNKMNCNATYTLKEVEGNIATISIEGDLFGSGDKFGNEFSMEGKLTGIFKVDIKTGWPKTADTHQDFTLKMGGKDTPFKYDINCKVE